MVRECVPGTQCGLKKSGEGENYAKTCAPECTHTCRCTSEDPKCETWKSGSRTQCKNRKRRQDDPVGDEDAIGTPPPPPPGCDDECTAVDKLNAYCETDQFGDQQILVHKPSADESNTTKPLAPPCTLRATVYFPPVTWADYFAPTMPGYEFEAVVLAAFRNQAGAEVKITSHTQAALPLCKCASDQYFDSADKPYNTETRTDVRFFCQETGTSCFERVGCNEDEIKCTPQKKVLMGLSYGARVSNRSLHSRMQLDSTPDGLKAGIRVTSSV
jgi:hypothetical protein